MWVAVVLVAATLQVARNGLQRGLMESAGPWAATLVRFLFGLPFAWLFVVCVVLLSPGLHPVYSTAFWSAALTGALAQVLATASLLIAMQRAGFAVGTALQQSSLPLSAVIGALIFHDSLSMRSWIGVVVTTIGLAVLSWPTQAATGPRSMSGAMLGLLSGASFGFSLNAFRHSILIFEPHHYVFAVVANVAIIQTIQAACLTLCLQIFDRPALANVLVNWRRSLSAGCCGTCASIAWFLALALTPAVAVRAVGIVEAPISAIAGRRFFHERLNFRQLIAGTAVLAGVLFTVLS